MAGYPYQLNPASITIGDAMSANFSKFSVEAVQLLECK